MVRNTAAQVAPVLGGRIAGAAQQYGGAALSYAKANPLITAGVGLGAAGVGYGAYRMLGPSQYNPEPDYKEQAVVAQDQRRVNRAVQTPEGQYTEPQQQPYQTPRPNTVRMPSFQEVELTKQDLLKAKLKQYNEEQKNLKEAALAQMYGNTLPDVNL